MDNAQKIATKMTSTLQQQAKEPACDSMLADKISALGKKRLAVICGTSICRLILTILGLVSVGMLFDWIFDFSIGVRALLLLAYILIAGILIYYGIFKQIVNKPDDEQLALMVEKAFPVFKSRLISSIQFLKSDEFHNTFSLALIKRLLQETSEIAKPLDFSSIVSTRQLNSYLALTTLILLLSALAFYQTYEVSGVLFRRVFLSSIEVPRKTRVEVITGDKIVGRGDSIEIMAKARGLIPSNGELIISHSLGKEARYLMNPNSSDSSLFSIKLDNLQDSFNYRVKLNDGISKRYNIEVITRPEVAFLECIQEYPEYTGLGQVRKNPGDLGILAGSKLKLKITATKPVKGGRLHLAGLDTDVPLVPVQNSKQELTGEIEIPANKLSGFSIFLADNYGVESKTPVLYKIEIIPDKPPAVKIAYPERKEELYTRLARILIGIEASDDFGIDKIKIHYKIDTVDKGAEKIIELDLNNEKPKNLRRRFEWELFKLEPSPSEGSTIEYWLEAIDTNNKTGPGIGLSERYLAKIVTEAEKRADLMARVSEYLTGLGEVADEQEKLSQSLGEIILQKTK